MANTPNKTTPTDADVDAFVAAVEHPVRRRDAERLIALMSRITGEPPRMWGPTLVGFGSYHYRYASGREGDAGAAGFSPRKAATTVYLPDGVDAHSDLLATLGPHTVGVSCVYIKDLDTVDLGVLEEVVRRSYATVSAETFGDG
ncbi:DUF1801 domain-containing protein [Cellulomonas sp. Root137]|uniref:DUF1801 domain-containing protein n=1 Tax=Cellulomonas sp. Root137 TaxID=1736459 RepID=UPI0006F61C37|nr:DUF1801 domain-containing protein [Cellulomonas sp. Root137]KQY47858.1 hypothetical protein ASD18_11435 [Cellulomonas sp. Root137]KRD44968.1 hypothetical protein ASE38_13185 [Cellulomonas sp. Root930]